MKRFIILMLIAMAAGCAYAQSMKMVVDSRGNAVGRYIRTNANTYTVDIQDECEVPKEGLKIVTFSAAAGQGVVYRNFDRTGNINVRNQPSTSGKVIAKLIEDDYMCYPCLGKVNGWYKIRINGKVGYVREDMAKWDGMDTM